MTAWSSVIGAVCIPRSATDAISTTSTRSDRRPQKGWCRCAPKGSPPFPLQNGIDPPLAPTRMRSPPVASNYVRGGGAGWRLDLVMPVLATISGMM